MSQPSAKSRPIPLVMVSLVLLVSAVATGWADDAREEICNVSADSALGLRGLFHCDNAPSRTAPVSQRRRARALSSWFCLRHEGRYTEEYLEAAKLGLDKWDLYLNLGLAFLGRNDSLKATNALKMAVLLGSDHPEAHFNLALVFERRRQLPEALQEITAALRLAPEDPEERNARAVICAELEDLACARDEWTRLLRVAPEYVPARANLAILNGSNPPPAASGLMAIKRLSFTR
jgi:tetratricopeptide (TPR) repeat protein